MALSSCQNAKYIPRHFLRTGPGKGGPDEFVKITQNVAQTHAK
jgi:hypothetical protein